MTKFLVLNFHAKHQIFNGLNTWLIGAINKLLKNNRSIVISEAQGKKDIVRLLYIYTQEKMWHEYMSYIRKDPSIYNIDDAPNEVKNLYRDEIVTLYAAAVRNYFQQASNRDSYREGVVFLRKLIQYGGTEEAEQIATEQKSRTPRRPALIDELSKL